MHGQQQNFAIVVGHCHQTTNVVIGNPAVQASAKKPVRRAVQTGSSAMKDSVVLDLHDFATNNDKDLMKDTQLATKLEASVDYLKGSHGSKNTDIA